MTTTPNGEHPSLVSTGDVAMRIELFDTSLPLATHPQHGADLRTIDTLWRHISFGEAPEIKEPLSPEELQIFSEGSDYFILREEEQQRIIGAVCIASCNTTLARIDALAIDPEHRRQGYARALAKRAIEHCWDLDYEQIMTHAMPASIPLFRSLNFEAFETNSRGALTMFLERQNRSAQSRSE